MNEENGDAGGNQYLKDMQASNDLIKHSFMLESDSGAFMPYGIGLSCALTSSGGCSAAKAQLQLIANALLTQIGSNSVEDNGEGN